MNEDPILSSDGLRVKLTRRYVIARGERQRPNEWQVRRYAKEDWLLNVRVQRVWRRRQFQISLFLAEDHEKFVKDAGVMGGLIFSLSEAYDKLGKMEIHFTGPPEGHEPEVPASIRRVSQSLGVRLRHKRYISDDEGRHLYARLTGLSERAVESLARRGVDPIKACFCIHRGLWTKEQVELIARHAHAPERVFSGQVHAERRVLYLHDMVLLRIAVLSERLQALCTTLYGPPDQAAAGEWTDDCRLHLTLSKPVGWSDDGRDIRLPAEARIQANLVARDADGYKLFGQADLQSAAGSAEPCVLVVTRDFDWVDQESRGRLIAAAAEAGVLIVRVVDTAGEIDADIDQRIARVVSTRRGAPERPD